jgi:predicted O-methyltransferase YrrM
VGQLTRRIAAKALPKSLYTKLDWQRRNQLTRKRHLVELVEWERNGRPVPPPQLVKQQTLQSYAKEFHLKVLVETGTYEGDTVEALRGDFDRIYSIELDEVLHEKAKDRFKRAKHIELIFGDSATELPGVVRELDQPALFWLDSHYSGGATAKGDKDTPIREELSCILDSLERGHVIVIDDARLFGNTPDYPSLQELSDYVRAKRANLKIEVMNDSIRITE